MKIDNLIQSIKGHTEEAIIHLDIVIDLLRSRSVEADFFRGMINRIKSERKRICRQITLEKINESIKENSSRI